MKKCIALILFAVISSMVLISCSKTQTQGFPDRHIVYQANDVDEPMLGFINADGSLAELVTTDFYAIQPTWSADGKMLLFRQAPGDTGYTHSRPGYISIWKDDGTTTKCNWRKWQIGWIASPLPDPKQTILLDNYSRIVLVDIDKCKEVSVFVEVEDSDPGELQKITSFSVSSSLNFILYTQESVNPRGFSMKLWNKESKEVDNIGQGINAALSPNAKLAAYTWFDGIYIISLNDLSSTHLIDYDSRMSGSNSLFENVPPAPQWSPDGKWLIYHLCLVPKSKGMCAQIEDYSIYKLDIANGQEIKLVDGGIYPAWSD